MAFGPGEVAVDEAVSMDASDVGWGDTPTTTADTGWATFDSFTDIRMAPSRCELDMTISHVQPGPVLKYLAKLAASTCFHGFHPLEPLDMTISHVQPGPVLKYLAK